MPYNRYNDTLQALNAGSDLVTSFSNDSIKRQAMGNTMEDRAIEKANERQIDSNLTLRKNGKAMGGTNQIQNESNRQFTNAALVDELQQGIELKEVDRAWGVNFIQGARDTPNDELPDYYAKVKPQTEGQLQFVANYSEKIAQTKEFQGRFAKALKTEVEAAYKNYSDSLTMAQFHIKDGNRDLAEQVLMKTINEMPHTINIEKNNDGTFNIVFREGGVNSGYFKRNATLEEIIQEARQVPPKQFKSNYVGLRLQLHKENLTKAKEYKTWVNKKGETINVYEQSDRFNPTEENVVFGFDSNGKSLNNGEPQKYTDLMGKGFSPQNLADDLKTQQIATLEDNQIKYKEQTKLAKAKQTALGKDNNSKELYKVIDNAAKLFGLKGDIDYTENDKGEMKPESRNAYVAMLDFYNERKSSENGLTGTERERYFGAKKAVAAIRKLNGTPDEQNIEQLVKHASNIQDKSELDAYMNSLGGKKSAVLEGLKQIQNTANKQRQKPPFLPEQGMQGPENNPNPPVNPPPAVEDLDAIEPSTYLNDMPIIQTKNGYMIKENGQWRSAEQAEIQQAVAQMQKAGYGNNAGFHFPETKFSGGGIGQQQSAMGGTVRGTVPTIPGGRF
jgi:hypothetical protein